MQRVGAIAEAGLHPALGGARHGEQRRHFFPRPLPCPAAVAPRGRRGRRVRRPPGGEARGIEIARPQWRQRGGGSGGRGEWAGGGPGGQPAEQADEAERVGDGAVAVGHRVVRRISPVRRVGGTGEGLRQAARTVADRGECGAGSKAGRAEREIERVDPGVGVGEPAGGLGGGHAGEQAVAHRIGCGGGAGIEPGERVGGVAQRDEQAGQRGAGQPAIRAGRRCRPDRRPGPPGGRAGRRRFRPGCPARTGAAGPHRRRRRRTGVLQASVLPPQGIGIIGPACALCADSGEMDSALRGFSPTGADLLTDA